jgi:peptidyl-dipeptidase Dcp
MAGALLTRVERVFGNITNTDTNDTLNRLDVEITPELSRERDAIYLDSVLFARVNSVHERRASLGLDADALRLVELQYRDFVRAGAALDAAARQRLGELNTRIAELSTHFRQNMLKETKAFVLLITDTNELSGLSPQSIAAARAAALLGFASHATYELDTRMAKTPEQAREFLFAVWRPALERAGAELADMQAIADGEGQDFAIAGWDWWYYAEKLRQRKFAVDETQLRPFFELGNVRRGAFHVAGKLFGPRFEPLENVPTWHPAVRAWAVHGREGAFLGVFMADDHTRDSKRGGAGGARNLRAALRQRCPDATGVGGPAARRIPAQPGFQDHRIHCCRPAGPGLAWARCGRGGRDPGLEPLLQKRGLSPAPD